jgi:hypothetical protein
MSYQVVVSDRTPRYFTFLGCSFGCSSELAAYQNHAGLVPFVGPPSEQ